MAQNDERAEEWKRWRKVERLNRERIPVKYPIS